VADADEDADTEVDSIQRSKRNEPAGHHRPAGFFLPGVFMSANHHLWWNRGSWWVAFTVLRHGYLQERVRRPLGTRDEVEARTRRDSMMDAFRRTPGCELSLRLPRRAASAPESTLVSGLAS
jgi:hypothetical protein